MFRALLLFPPGTSKTSLEAPLSVTMIDGPSPAKALDIEPQAVFTTAVGHSSKRTLASWHVTTPQEVVDHMLDLVHGVDRPQVSIAADPEFAVDEGPSRL